MQIIPLNDLPSQTLTAQLAGQSCSINIYQKSTGLYLDLYVNDVLIIGGVICQNLNRIVRNLYLGFLGDFVFEDTQGNSDPVYTGNGDIGTRFQLVYLEVDDLGGVG